METKNINVENLTKLAEYLKEYRSKYQKLLNSRFDMSDYLTPLKYGEATSAGPSRFSGECIAKAYCGTAACAVGHALAATGIRGEPDEGWGGYTARVLGEEASNMYWYHWAFSAAWARFDNTPEGAAFRILYALKYGVPFDQCNDVQSAFYSSRNEDGVNQKYGYEVLPHWNDIDHSYLRPVEYLPHGYAPGEEPWLEDEATI